MSKLRTLWNAAGWMFPLAALSFTQEANIGQVSGFVLDPSGTGYFVLPNLPSGSHSLAAGMEGFKRLVHTGLALDAKGGVSFYDDPASKNLFHNLPRSYTETYKDLFHPRLGFSWSPFRSNVIRGGAGIYHTPDVFYSLSSQGVNFPLVPSANIQYGKLDAPSGGLASPSSPPRNVSVDPDLKSPVLYRFSFGVQRAPGSILLDVAYVGQRTRNYFYTTNLNPRSYYLCDDNRAVNCNSLNPYRGYDVLSRVGAFNHPQIAFNGLNTTFGDARFGQVTTMYNSRIIQMSLKLNF